MRKKKHLAYRRKFVYVELEHEDGKKTHSLGARMDRWNLETKSWERTPSYYDINTGEWVTDPSHVLPPSNQPNPPKATEPVKAYHPTHSTYPGYTPHTTYKPSYPWDGVDPKKFPQTWWTLLMMYFGDWWRTSKYVHEGAKTDGAKTEPYKPFTSTTNTDKTDKMTRPEEEYNEYYGY